MADVEASSIVKGVGTALGGIISIFQPAVGGLVIAASQVGSEELKKEEQKKSKRAEELKQKGGKFTPSIDAEEPPPVSGPTNNLESVISGDGKIEWVSSIFKTTGLF